VEGRPSSNPTAFRVISWFLKRPITIGNLGVTRIIDDESTTFGVWRNPQIQEASPRTAPK